MTLGLLAGELLQQGIVVPGVAPTPDTGSFFLRPTSDDANTNWQGDGGPIWSQIDEVTPDDSGSAVSSSGTGNRPFSVFLDNPNKMMPSETVDGGVKIGVRSRGVSTLAIQLYSGSSVASGTLIRTVIWVVGDATWLDVRFGLLESEISAMGDWQNVLLLLSANNNSTQLISQAEIVFISGSFSPVV